jgi:hypothetical protein
MDQQARAPFTGALTKAGVAAGTTTTLTQTLAAGATANIVVIRGKQYSVAALSNTATPTTDWATGKAFVPILPSQGSVFWVGFNAAGAFKAIQGQVSALDVNGAFITAPTPGGTGPSGSAPGAGGSGDFCPIAYIIVKADSTASAAGWIFGSSNFGTPPTGLTYAYQDICGLPDRPQIA